MRLLYSGTTRVSQQLSKAVCNPDVDMGPEFEDSQSSVGSVESTPLQDEECTPTKAIPELDELQSVDGSGSSSDQEDGMIPDLDLLTPGDDGEKPSRHRVQECDDPQLQERRDRNRKAATACRKRQKERGEELSKEVARLQNIESAKKEEIQQLRDELRKYKMIYLKHLPKCVKVRKILLKKQQLRNQSRQTQQTTIPHPNNKEYTLTVL